MNNISATVKNGYNKNICHNCIEFKSSIGYRAEYPEPCNSCSYITGIGNNHYKSKLSVAIELLKYVYDGLDYLSQAKIDDFLNKIK